MTAKKRGWGAKSVRASALAGNAAKPGPLSRTTRPPIRRYHIVELSHCKPVLMNHPARPGIKNEKTAKALGDKSIWGMNNDGYVRFCGGRRRLRRLRGREPSLRGFQDVRGADRG